MPKDRRMNSSSFDRAMVPPYSCSSNTLDPNNCDGSSSHVGDEKEWEDTRCPICMEHPHNSVLLLCSSREKGCRPFICDTSYRHSNCLDQFRKSAAVSSLQIFSQEQHESELVCPLCRGLVTGWDVIQPARKFMNSKTRSCSLETCSFVGNYGELRKHARFEHPSERPSEASPTRQSNWTRLEQEREIVDALSFQSDIEYDYNGWPTFADWGDDDWSDESFFDFPSGMSDIEDELVDEMFSELSLSLFILDSSSPEEEIMDSGSSGRSERIHMTDVTMSNLGSRSNNQFGNALGSSRQRPIFNGENGATVSRSRSNHHRGNSPTMPSSGYWENEPTVSRSRSNHHRGNAPAMLRVTSSYHRYNDSTSSRSRSSYHHRENHAVASSRMRSGYHQNTEYEQTSSRANFRYSHRDFPDPVRRNSNRRLPGSSGQRTSDFQHRGE